MSLVYSTDGGRMCPLCRHAIAGCSCKSEAAAPAGPGGVARVSRESKGRGGRTVTLVRGCGLAALAMAALGKRLRTACGAGGTVKDGTIEIQGDHCDRVIEWLKAEGIPVKRAGG